MTDREKINHLTKYYEDGRSAKKEYCTDPVFDALAHINAINNDQNRDIFEYILKNNFERMLQEEISEACETPIDKIKNPFHMYIRELNDQ